MAPVLLTVRLLRYPRHPLSERQHDRALAHLARWIAIHPDYKNLRTVADDKGERATVENVAEMYKAAAKQAPRDPEPRVVLGVLHNLSTEYDDAVDILREATKIAPNDFTLWNKLGATLANASQPQEALYAYQKAIDIRPKYIRGKLS